MRVSEDDIVLKSSLTDELGSKSPYACAGIHDNNLIVFAPYFETGCITTVF
jgi:hypothetical protein